MNVGILEAGTHPQAACILRAPSLGEEWGNGQQLKTARSVGRANVTEKFNISN